MAEHTRSSSRRVGGHPLRRRPPSHSSLVRSAIQRLGVPHPAPAGGDLYRLLTAVCLALREERHEVVDLLRRERLLEVLGHHVGRVARGDLLVRVDDPFADELRVLALEGLVEVGPGFAPLVPAAENDVTGTALGYEDLPPRGGVSLRAGAGGGSASSVVVPFRSPSVVVPSGSVTVSPTAASSGSSFAKTSTAPSVATKNTRVAAMNHPRRAPGNWGQRAGSRAPTTVRTR